MQEKIFFSGQQDIALIFCSYIKPLILDKEDRSEHSSNHISFSYPKRQLQKERYNLFSPGLNAERVRNMLVLHHQIKPLLPALGSAVVTIEPDDLKGLLQPKWFYNLQSLHGKSLRHACRLCHNLVPYPLPNGLFFSWELSGVMNSGTGVLGDCVTSLQVAKDK